MATSKGKPRPAKKTPTTGPSVPAKAATKAATRHVPKAAPSAPAASKKPKLVKDSFRMPKEDFELIDRLKRRAEALRHPAKKSLLLRAGLGALSRMSDEALAFALEAVPGRRS